MADPCETLTDWDNMDAADRLEALKEMINEKLTDWGYEPVEVEQYVSDDAHGEWDFDENTIYLDQEHLESPDFEDVLNTGMHEAVHAARDLEHGEPTTGGGGHTAEGFEGEIYGDELEVFSPGDFVPDDLHREAYIAGEQWARSMLEDCISRRSSESSSIKDEMPLGDMDIVSESASIKDEMPLGDLDIVKEENNE